MGDSLDFLVDDTGCRPSTIGGTGCLASLAYGGKKNKESNPDAFYVGVGSRIWHRATGGDQPAILFGYQGGEVRSLAIDPEDYAKVYVVDNNSLIWASSDEGTTLNQITGNLGSLSTNIRAIQVPQPGKIVVAGQGGVFFTPNAGASPWAPLAQALPHSLFWELHYSSSDDVLVAASIGRGAWTLSGYFTGVAPTAPTESMRSAKPTGTASVLLPVPQLQLPPVRAPRRP